MVFVLQPHVIVDITIQNTVIRILHQIVLRISPVVMHLSVAILNNNVVWIATLQFEEEI